MHLPLFYSLPRSLGQERPSKRFRRPDPPSSRGASHPSRLDLLRILISDMACACDWFLDLGRRTVIFSPLESDVGLEFLVVSSLAGYESVVSACMLGWGFGGIGLVTVQLWTTFAGRYPKNGNPGTRMGVIS